MFSKKKKELETKKKWITFNEEKNHSGKEKKKSKIKSK